MISSSTPPVTKAVPKGEKKPNLSKKPNTQKGVFFTSNPVTTDTVPDEKIAHAKFVRLVTFVGLETIIIAVLCGFLVLGIPLFQPIYQYYGLNPDKKLLQLVPLTMPNMTNRAVLSWATTSITEIMTYGFGDFEKQLVSQKARFTPDGWDSFVKAFQAQKIAQTFKQNQLVLTTVPSNTPVIVAQGINEKHVYQWRIQMPVVMTYATNNNRNERKTAIIELTIERVSPEQNAASIGIANWTLKQ